MSSTTTTATSSALDLLKTGYPSQYYGVASATTGTLSQVIDVWDSADVRGQTIKISDLLAASSLVPLTAEQFAMAASAQNIWSDATTNTLTYPARYYASYDTTAAQPTPVTGWYDTWDMSATTSIPAASAMIAIAAADWSNQTTFRISSGRGVENGAIIDYTPAPAAVPLKTQAETQLTWINQQASLAGAMGQTFTADMKAYVAAIQGIANGTDTTSTALPAEPTDVMT